MLVLSCPFAPAQVEAWLEGPLLLLALAGRASVLKNGVLRCRLGCYDVILQAVPDLRRRKNQAWKEVATHPPLLAGPAGPAGAAQEEHLLLQRNASAVGLHHITFARLRESVYTWSQNVRRLDDSLLPSSLWPAGRGGVRRKDELERILQKRHWSSYYDPQF